MTWMHLSANENRVLVSHDLTETTEWQNRTYLCQKECSVGTNTLCLVHLRTNYNISSWASINYMVMPWLAEHRLYIVHVV